MKNLEIVSGVCALTGATLLISSNYNKTVGKEKQVQNMRYAGGVLVGVAIIGMLLNKSHQTA